VPPATTALGVIPAQPVGPPGPLTPNPSTTSPPPADPVCTAPVGAPRVLGIRDWEVLAEHRQRLLRLAVRCGASPDDAQDIVQDALLRAAGQQQLDPGQAGGLLTTVVRRLVIDQHRDTARRQQLSQQRRLAPGPQPGPEDDVCDHAEAAWLATRADRLPPRERLVLLARADGQRTTDLAEELACTTKAVELLHRRARRTLHALAATTWALTCLAFAAHPAAVHQHRARLPQQRTTTSTAMIRHTQRARPEPRFD